MTLSNSQAFEVQCDENGSTVSFKGALRLTGTEDYAPILDILRGYLDRHVSQIVLDLRELDFLNSSGITMFSRFVIDTRDRGSSELLIIASSEIPWHGRSLKNLQRLMPSLSIHMI